MEIDSDEEQQDEHKVAFFNSELNLYLKAKNHLYYQVPLYNKHSALTLEQSLLEFTGLDVLDEDNKFICQHCTNGKERRCLICVYTVRMCVYAPTDSQSEAKLCRVSKQILIHKLPPVLILQMKRFSIGNNDVTKDNRFVYFPHMLDMAPYCTTQCFEVHIFLSMPYST